jgi:hypothetical protein
MAERKTPDPELRQLWTDDAWQRLRDALGTAFGGLPAGIHAQPVVLRGKPGKVLTGLACQQGDLLVVGTGAGARCGGWDAAVSAATAWPTPACLR